MDDSENDRFLIRNALARSEERYVVSEAWDVQTAIAYLADAGLLGTAKNPMPDLILCDLGLPGCDGFAFLDWFNLQPQLQRVKVAIMSGVCTLETRRRASLKKACACVDKGDLVKEPEPFLMAVKNCF